MSYKIYEKLFKSKTKFDLFWRGGENRSVIEYSQPECRGTQGGGEEVPGAGLPFGLF